MAYWLTIGGCLVSARTHTKRHRLLMLFAILVAIVAIVILLISQANLAQGANETDSSTIGIGSSQSSIETVSAKDRITGVQETSDSNNDSASSESSKTQDSNTNLAQSAQRSITVEDPDPVIVPVAVDYSNSLAVEKAQEVCTLDPLPTAVHISPDINDGTWLSGTASAYNVSSNDDGNGNFGVSDTASGIDLYNESVTVAVPEDQADLLGSIVEIYYDGSVVVATVTDTGGFGQFGRVLDLAPGVYQAFGVSSPNDWGTRTIYYRFL